MSLAFSLPPPLCVWREHLVLKDHHVNDTDDDDDNAKTERTWQTPTSVPEDSTYASWHQQLSLPLTLTMPIVPLDGVVGEAAEVETANQRIRFLQSLHLILPASMLPVKDVDVDDQPPTRKLPTRRGTATTELSVTPEKKRLRGYETLQELRDKAANFRQGYLNWRKFRPRGAKGETTDIFTGRKPAETSAKVEFTLLHKQASKSREYRSTDTFDDNSQNIPPDVSTQTQPQEGQCVVKEYVESFDVKGAVKTLEEEDTWLRFYYNPFTPAETAPVAPIREATLPQLASRGVQVPTYDRDPRTVTHWILHLGVGQFHRSHQLVFMDDLLTGVATMNNSSTASSTSNLASTATTSKSIQSRCGSKGCTKPTLAPAPKKWGYCGVGLMPFDQKMAQALRQQDLLYSVMTRTNVSSCVRVIGSMFDYVFAYDEPELAFKRLMDPNLHIVSMTITEKGYCQNVDGSLDTENPLVRHDLELFKTSATTRQLESPRTALGFLYWGLRERAREGLPPFTVMSCDNLPENGHVARNMVTAFAQHVDPQFSKWIVANVRFPCSMVDRITPATVLEHREILAKDYGVLDEWPVVTEEFMQWAIEDNFTCRPPWETVGALLVSDVRPLELMKLRLLNGGHSMIGYIGYIAGYRFVDDAVNDVKLSSFLRAYMDEVTSTIRNVSVEVERYKEKIVERFGNRMIKDRLLRLCEDGSTKLYNTTKDALAELVTEDRHIHWIALGLAAFIMFLAVSPNDIILDAKKDLLIALAKDAVDHTPSTSHVAEFLRNVYGSTLCRAPSLVHQTCLALFALKSCSVERVLNCGGTLEALFEHQVRSSAFFNNFLSYVVTCQGA